MKRKTNKFKSSIITITIIFSFIPLFADTIYLNDNLIITGKIIKKNNKYYIKNSNGTSKFDKKSVKKMIITKNHEEDIKFYEKLNKKVDAKQIKKDFEAGTEKEDDEDLIEIDHEAEKKKTEDEKSIPDRWNYSRIGFSMAYFTTLKSDDGSKRSINEILPVGIGFNVSWELGLEFNHKHFMIPALKIEHSHIYFAKRMDKHVSKKVLAYSIYPGLMWAIPGFNTNWGFITLSIAPGITFLYVENGITGKSGRDETFSLKSSLGYEIQIKGVVLQIHLDYNYILDNTTVFNGLGISLGFATNL